ncbi:MAG: glycosyltransferase family 4 protein, partial [Bacteroidota bacterium]
LRNLHSTGQNPRRDYRLYQEFVQIFREERINFVYLYNAKPMIYGGIAATFRGIPYVSTVAGLGNPFTGAASPTRFLMMILFKLSMWKAHRVFFHNREHRALFRRWLIVSEKRSETVAGSGVDMERFPCALREKPQGPFTFLMFSRLLISKGAPLYAKAAAILKKEFSEVEFHLLGPLENNKYSVTQAQLDQWIDKGWIQYFGETNEVQPYVEKAHVVVYPSYYAEGTPRALLEAASMCKPLITTDNVGCHDVVQEGVNGLLIPMNDLAALAEAMRQMIIMDNDTYYRMAKKSRDHITKHYEKQFVIDKYLQAIKEI